MLTISMKKIIELCKKERNKQQGNSRFYFAHLVSERDIKIMRKMLQNEGLMVQGDYIYLYLSNL